LCVFAGVGFAFLVSFTDAAIQAAAFTSGATHNGYGLIAAGGIIMSIPFLYWIVVFGSEPTSHVLKVVEEGQSFAFVIPKIEMKRAVKEVDGGDGGGGGRGVVGEETLADGVDLEAAKASMPAVVEESVENTGGTAAPHPPPPNIPRVVGQALALFEYEANAADPNEVSFSKGQLMEVLDNRGKWWQARFVDKEGRVVMGIVPNMMHFCGTDIPCATKSEAPTLTTCDSTPSQCADHLLQDFLFPDDEAPPSTGNVPAFGETRMPFELPRLSLNTRAFSFDASAFRESPNSAAPRLSLDASAFMSPSSFFFDPFLDLDTDPHTTCNTPTQLTPKLSQASLNSILSPILMKPRKKLQKAKSTSSLASPTLSSLSSSPDTRARDHECEICHARFLRHQDLFRHSSTHSGRKDFACLFGCGATFARSDAVTRHCRKRSCRAAPVDVDDA
ncbi:Transmembrane osmosensor, partial [Podochytrium sp. JEL0797]